MVKWVVIGGHPGGGIITTYVDQDLWHAGILILSSHSTPSKQINVTAVQKGLGKVRIWEAILGKRRQCFWHDTNCWNHWTDSNIWEYFCTNPTRTGHNYVKVLGSEEIMGSIWEDNNKVVSE